MSQLNSNIVSRQGWNPPLPSHRKPEKAEAKVMQRRSRKTMEEPEDKGTVKINMEIMDTCRSAQQRSTTKREPKVKDPVQKKGKAKKTKEGKNAMRKALLLTLSRSKFKFNTQAEHI